MAEPKQKRRSRLRIFVVLILVLGLAGGAYLLATGKIQRPGAASATIATGAVTTITAVSSVTDSGPIDAQALAQAPSDTNIAFSRYQNIQAKWDAGDHSDLTYRLLQATQSAYQSALDKKTQLELRIQADQANKDDTLSKAQKKHNDAVNNLNNALKGPDAMKLALAQSKVDVATAALADAQQKMADLKAGGAPDDVKTAQARVQAAQAIVAALGLKAPVEGAVLGVNNQPRDAASPAQAAVNIANRSQYHVDVLVDESEVPTIRLGNPAQVTFS